jgi:hypothetical protein
MAVLAVLAGSLNSRARPMVNCTGNGLGMTLKRSFAGSASDLTGKVSQLVTQRPC